MRRVALATLAVLCGVATDAHAQSGALTFTLTDPLTSLPISRVLPGQAARVTLTLTWEPHMQLAGIAGDILCQPVGIGGEGVVSDRFSEFRAGGLVTLGSVVGDDIIGLNAASTPAFYTPGGWYFPPWGNNNGLIVERFDWTAPHAAGLYSFDFNPRPLYPGGPALAVFPSIHSPQFALLPTTTTAATLTVVPGPHAAAVICLVAWAKRRKRP